MKRPARQIGPLAAVLSGFLLWSAAFLGIYGAQATGCSLGWDATILFGPLTVQRAVLLGLFVLIVAGHAAIVRWLTAATSLSMAPTPKRRTSCARRRGGWR